MNTECTPTQLEFHPFGSRQVIGRFDGGRITSDGGGVLLREVDHRLGLLNRLGGCFTDYRNPSSVGAQRSRSGNPADLWFGAGL